MRRPSVLQINAVVLAVALTGCYVWFRAVRAQQHNERVLPGSKTGRLSIQPSAATTSSTASSPSTSPAISKAVFYGSKSAPVELTSTPRVTGNSEPPDIVRNATTAPKTPHRNAHAIGADFQLNTDISAEFAVGADICPGLPDPMPQTPNVTHPATAPSSSAKSRQP